MTAPAIAAPAARTKLDHALALAAEGFHVFPLRPKGERYTGRHGKPRVSDGKQPAVDNWPAQATRDEATIRRWWREDPARNIGVHCGRYGDGNQALCVLDVDVKKGKPGDATLSGLVADMDVLGDTFPATRTHRTPTGGRHFVFVVDEPTAQGENKLGPGLDVKSGNGYVVAPGSDIDGVPYHMEDSAPAAPLPTHVRQRLGAAVERQAKPMEWAPGAVPDDPYNIALAREYLEREEPAIEGAGGDAWTLQAAERVGDLGITEAECLALMLDVYNPRCAPPWAPDELAVKVANAYRYRKTPLGCRTAEADFFGQPVPDSAPRPRRLNFLRPSEVVLPKVNPYLVKGLIDQGSTAVLYGQSNTGKTFLAMDLAGHIAAGQPWGGRKVRQGLVVYVATEASRSAQIRLEALKRRLDCREFPLALVPYSVDLRSEKKDAAELVALVREAEAAFGAKCLLIVVDTLARAFAGGNENASDHMGAFVANIGDLREKCDCAVLIVHHKGKNEAAGARGHSSLRAAVETELEVGCEEATGRRSVTATKQRDMEAGKPFGFVLHPLTLGCDDEGDPITSCTVALEDDPEYDFEPLTTAADLPTVQRGVFNAVKAALADDRASENNGCRWACTKLIALHLSGKAAEYSGLPVSKLPAIASWGDELRNQMYEALRTLSVGSGPLAKNEHNQYTTANVWGEPNSVGS